MYTKMVHFGRLCPLIKAKRVEPEIFLLICLILLSAIFLFCSFGRAVAEQNRYADMVLKGAVYTMDASRSWAGEVAVSDGRILYVGHSGGAAKFTGPHTKVLDLQGAMILPGFNDSHAHPVFGGEELGQCLIYELSSEAEVLERIRNYVLQNREKKWITGSGWDPPTFPGGVPHKKMLDRIIPKKPAFFSSADGHSAWVNSRALEIAHIGKDTPDPAGGRIERDKGTGEPSGTLRESAVQLVAKFLPPVSEEERLKGLSKALKMFNSSGITSVVDATATENVMKAYEDLERRGELTLRVWASLNVEPDKGKAQIGTLRARRERYQQGGYLQAKAVKLYLDGVMESGTAALIEPYLDRPNDCGSLLIEPDNLGELVTMLDREGFQIHMHAIGDRAVREGLDAIEKAGEINGFRDSRHTIAHLELIHPQDLSRFRRLGVVANFQPLWAFPDPYITELTEPALGPIRSRLLYPIGSIVGTGAVVAGGSDWSVTSLNPLEAIQVAVTRQSLEEAGKDPWLPAECVSLPEILAAYTINGAYLRHDERETGSIEMGKKADIAVLEKNLFDIKPGEIHKVKVLLTLLEGKVVFRDEESPLWRSLPDGSR